MTMPLAMQSYKMDNPALNILAKKESMHQLIAQSHLHKGIKQTHANSESEEGFHLRLLDHNKIGAAAMDCLPVQGVSLAPTQGMLGIDPAHTAP